MDWAMGESLHQAVLLFGNERVEDADLSVISTSENYIGFARVEVDGSDIVVVFRI